MGMLVILLLIEVAKRFIAFKIASCDLKFITPLVL